MTCEVAVMNKYAVVIAADSAVTTTDGTGTERYSKGGNKLFQLSHFDPVGVMIFGGAALDGVPWEIIIKAYRDQLKERKFATLFEYSSDFFDYVSKASHFFPKEDIEKNFENFIQTTAGRLIITAKNSHPAIFDETKGEDERKADWNAFVAAEHAALDDISLHVNIPSASFDTAISNVSKSFLEAASDFLKSQNLAGVIDASAWGSLSCKFFFKRFESVLNTTGIVFSGYGSTQYFPEIIEYRVSGFVNDDFVFTRNDRNSGEVTHDNPSVIFQFATTSEIDTFTTGVSFDAFISVNDAFQAHAKGLVEEVLVANGQPFLSDIDTRVTASAQAFINTWYGKMLQNHLTPMKRVIASLPIEEMVHLVETLVVLQSLKERVTTPKQSVGGPIDVAVITKSEGLVWIKRKHFFNSEKNLRYVMRQKALYD